MVAFYERHGEIERSLWRKLRTAGAFEAYSHEALETILQRYFGDKRLSDCGTPVMVTSYDIEHRKTVFIKSWHSDHSQLWCAEASRATSAAPTYFEPVNLEWAEQSRTLIDGGVFINSPAVSAYAEARKLFPDEPIAMLSLGTGELTRSIPYDEARTWGSALWVMSLLDCMFDGASKAADHQMRLFLGDHYLRLQTQLHYASDDMDDASRGNIRNLKQTANDQARSGALHHFFKINLEGRRGLADRVPGLQPVGELHAVCTQLRNTCLILFSALTLASGLGSGSKFSTVGHATARGRFATRARRQVQSSRRALSGGRCIG